MPQSLSLTPPVPRPSAALIDALASREIHGMVAWGVRAEARDIEPRIECRPRLHYSPRLSELTEVRQDSRQIEMRSGVISVGFKAPAQPNDRFGVGALPKFGDTDIQSPDIDGVITGREMERPLYVGFGLPGSTEPKLPKSDVRVPVGPFPIQCQRPLVFGDALSRAVRKSLHKAQDEMSSWMVR